MAKNKVDLGCAQLRGTFVLSGKVTGRFSNSFYQEGTGQNGNDWRRVRLGVEIEPDRIVYLDLFGSTLDNVYFSKTTKGADGKNKTETKMVKWADRFKTSKQLFGEDGYRLIGVTCGCKKTLDSKGKEINDRKYLTPFDACDEVGNLSDGDSVFIRGNITYSTYNDQHRVNFEPVQISLCKEIDFDDVDFQPNASFTQPIVVMGVAKNEDTPGEAIVNAKVVNYQSIEDCELYTRNAGLAKNLKKLGEYVHIKVWGDILVDGEVEEVKESADGWGSANKMDRVASPFKRKLMITGADPESIDNEAYSEDVIEHALEVIAGIQNAKKDFGKKDDKDDADDWGKSSKGNLDEDDDFDMELGI